MQQQQLRSILRTLLVAMLHMVLPGHLAAL
jgi:hypothetical protein